MTEERTTTGGSETPPQDEAADPGTTTTAPDESAGTSGETSTSGEAAAGSGAGAAGTRGKKSWRGRSRASRSDRAEKSGKAAKSGEDDESATSEKSSTSEKSEKQPKQKREKQVAEKKRRTPGHGMGVGEIRTLVARIVWVVCLVFALALAITALFVALKANSDNDAVRFIVDFADKVDLGVFDLRNPIKDFDTGEPPSTDTKTALFNYGIGAVVWLIIGRIGDRVIRP